MRLYAYAPDRLTCLFSDLIELEGAELEELDACVRLCWVGFDGIDI